jgi:hypothetical protein
MSNTHSDPGSEPMPGMPPNLQPERSKYPFQPAFIAFCKGFSIEQIAGSFNIPERVLERRAIEEHWSALKEELKLQKPATAPVAAALKDLEENRRKNFAMFEQLRDQLCGVIGQLAKGELEIERLFHNPKAGIIVKGTQAPGPSDLVSIATAAKIISEGTYRALGDQAATEESVRKAGAAPAHITVLLPGVVAGPRRAADPVTEAKDAQVVDLRGLPG